MFAELPNIKDKNGKTISTKKVELSGNSGKIATRVPLTSNKTQKFMELNQYSSINSIREDQDGKTTAIFYQNKEVDIPSSQRMLHSSYV